MAAGSSFVYPVPHLFLLVLATWGREHLRGSMVDANGRDRGLLFVGGMAEFA